MKRTLALLAVCYAAGQIGGLLRLLFLVGLDQGGALQMAAVRLTFHADQLSLYREMIWGGLWGLPFFLVLNAPRFRRHWIRKGLWLSLLPSLFELLYLLPNLPGCDLFGLGCGNLTPLVVVLANMVWGGLTGVTIRLLWGRG